MDSKGHPRHYLQYGAVQGVLTATKQHLSDVEVVVYSVSDMQHVIPNPNDYSVVGGVEHALRVGQFTQKDVRYVPLKYFNDVNNWSP